MTLSVGMLPKLTPLQFLTQKVGNRGGGEGKKGHQNGLGATVIFIASLHHFGSYFLSMTVCEVT